MARNSFAHTSDHDRHPEDWYPEPRFVVEQLLDAEAFEGEVLDPCCGGGTIVSVCRARGIPARGSDIVDRGFGEVRDLFSLTEPVDNIISNVPYRIAEACARHMFTLARYKVALILRMPFWESRERHGFFREYPLHTWYPCSDRPSMPIGKMTGLQDEHGAIIQPKNTGGTMPYGWWVYQIGYRGPTQIKLLELKPIDRTARQSSPLRAAS
jgi:hypothetical protein